MKLISCYIQNYGNISNTDILFEDNLTALCERNGYGKTTLASFIKAMFYGLDSDSQNRSFNERRHYYPFAGGLFGGNLTFESKGKQYKIERFFDEKSDRRDTISIYCNGKSIPKPEGDIGYEIFGIDKESFERTIFVKSDDLVISSTGSINKKINNFVDGSDSDTSFEEAIDRLETKSKEYKKVRGKDGLIANEKEKLGRLSEEINNKEKIKNTLEDKNKKCEEISTQVDELSKKISSAQLENVIIANWDSYDRMVKENELNKDKMNHLNEKYPLGMPTKDEVDEVKTYLGEINILKGKLSQKTYTSDDEIRFSKLNEKFSKEIPKDDKMDEIQKDIDRMDALNYELNTINKEMLSEEDKRLKQKFIYYQPTKEELDELKKNAERYKAAEEEFNEIPDNIFIQEYKTVEQKPINNQLFIILVIIFALFTLGGIIASFVTMAIGIALLAIGVIGLVIVGFLYLNKKTNLKTNGEMQNVAKENPQKVEAKRKAEKIYESICSTLMPYGISFNEGVQYAVALFCNEVKKYNELMEKTKNNKEKVKKLESEKDTLIVKLNTFFSLYQLNGDNYRNLISQLSSERNEYRSLSERNQNWSSDEEKIKMQIEKHSSAIQNFCEKYNLSDAQIKDEIKTIEKDISDSTMMREIINTGERNAQNFKNEKKLTIRPQGQSIDIEDLNKRMAEMQEDKTRLCSEIADNERDIETLDDLQAEYEQVEEKIKKYSADYDLLCKTIEVLKDANQTLKDKYIKPVRDKFLHYSEVLEDALGKKVIITSDFEIKYEREGKERSEQHLSSGNRSLCALCFRLALIDNMYTEEKPFVILDDPFVNLDEEHVEKAKALIEQLSKNIQVIYFTCHSSRAL